MITKNSAVFLFLLLAFGSAQADDKDGSIVHNGSTRTYFLHVPPGYTDEQPLPLVINLHFYGGSGHSQAFVSGMNSKSDAGNFIVVYPDAQGTTPSWDMNNDLDFISNLIDSLMRDYSIDTFRVYATGYSNGAFMAHVLACNLSKRIAAAAPVAAGLMITDWSEFKLDRPISTVHFHARNDMSVPYDGNEYFAPVEDMMRSWADVNGCDVGPDSFYNDSGALRQKWTNENGDVEIELWTTNEGGHAWPSLTSPHKISANDLMWDFFVAHPLASSTEPVAEETYSADVLLDSPIPSLICGSASVNFTLSRSQGVRIDVFDALGRRVGVLAGGRFEKGPHSVHLDVGNLRSGVYFLKITTSSVSRSARFVVIK